MRTIIKLVVIAIGALLLGLIFAYPLFASNVNPIKYPGGRAYITVDPVYAYFAFAPFNNSISGFWQGLNFSSAPNTINSPHGIISYLIILNVTSYCNATVYMESFRVDVSPYIKTWNNSTMVGSEELGNILSVTRVTNGLADLADKVYPAATRWEPNESRLVAFSGITEISNTSQLKTGNFYLGGWAEGTPIDGISSEGVGSTQMHMTIFGNELLYNKLLGPNQVLRFDWDGQIAYVDEGQ
jgi:hypothetical protein